MAQTSTTLRRQLQELLPVLTQQYHVESMALFGSYVRAEQRPDSDLDLLVTFFDTPDLFTFIRLQTYLSEQIGIPVDLVMKDTLKPHIGKNILGEAIPI
ncbi:DNA polymerase III subunit beta [bacterium]|nr:DNA polymerase III subunit beta [bacterium]